MTEIFLFFSFNVQSKNSNFENKILSVFLYWDHPPIISMNFNEFTVKLGYNDHGYNEFTAITN